MGEPSWQETLRMRLVDRNARESSYAPIIEQCMSLFHETCLSLPLAVQYPDVWLAYHSEC